MLNSQQISFFSRNFDASNRLPAKNTGTFLYHEIRWEFEVREISNAIVFQRLNKYICVYISIISRDYTNHSSLIKVSKVCESAARTRDRLCT